MQKETKKGKSAKEIQERLKRAVKPSSGLLSNPLILHAKETLKADFGLDDARRSQSRVGASAGEEPVGLTTDDDELAMASSCHTEPAHTEPAHTELAHTEPAHTEPAHTKPAHTKPAHTEPAHTEPAHTEPAHTEPAHTEPAHTEPAHTEPAHTEPAHTEPAHTEPAHTEPAHAEPADSTRFPGLGAALRMQQSETDETTLEIEVDAKNVFRAFGWTAEVPQYFGESYQLLERLLRAYGPKRYAALQLYVSLIDLGAKRKSNVIFATRADLINLMLATSNSTVTRAVQFGVEYGFFETKVLNVRKGSLPAGTYFRLLYAAFLKA